MPGRICTIFDYRGCGSIRANGFHRSRFEFGSFERKAVVYGKAVRCTFQDDGTFSALRPVEGARKVMAARIGSCVFCSDRLPRPEIENDAWGKLGVSFSQRSPSKKVSHHGTADLSVSGTDSSASVPSSV